MSIVRAFTTRRSKPEHLENVHIGRAASQRQGRPVHRTLISSPVVLLSSTNALSYDAPDIAGTAPIGGSRDFSTSSSRSSQEGSDASTFDISSNTVASSIENSPISPEPEPNHLSCYFKSAQERSQTRQSHSSFDAPVIPQRVPSHSKKAHERIHRKRSVQRMMSPVGTSRDLSRSSVEIFGAQSPPIAEEPKESPFGQELAQLDEVAEEFGHAVRDAEATEDATIMRDLNLAQFCASDYMNEIRSLLDVTFGEVSVAPCWF